MMRSHASKRDNVDLLWKEVSPSIVRIETQFIPIQTQSREIKGEERSFSGTGTIIVNNQGYILILTCGHLVAPLLNSRTDGRTIKVMFFNGKKSENFKVVSNIRDAANEIGLLYGFELEASRMNAVEFEMQPCQTGTEVYMGSYPYSVEFMVCIEGTCSNPNVSGHLVGRNDIPTLMAFDINAVQGSSGAAIFSESRRIISLFILCHNAWCRFPHERTYFDGVIKYGKGSQDVVKALNEICDSHGLIYYHDIYQKLSALVYKFGSSFTGASSSGGPSSSLMGEASRRSTSASNIPPAKGALATDHPNTEGISDFKTSEGKALPALQAARSASARNRAESPVAGHGVSKQIIAKERKAKGWVSFLCCSSDIAST